MWTSTLYLEPRRILLSKSIGIFYPDIYYTSLAPLQVENIPRQQLPSANWVRVRNRLAGICGSDLHLVRADGDLRVAPAAFASHQRMYPGHEVVGEVIEIGDDVQHLQVGDRVVLQRGANCISTGVHPPCRACAAGNYNLCEQDELPEPLPMGGGWSEEMLLHEQQLFLLPDTLSDEQGMLIEPTAVALHAVLRRLPQPGEQVLIIGAGTIGLLTLQIVRALAPLAEVTVLARHSFQVEQATRMGAAQIMYARSSYNDAQHITGGRLVSGLFGNRVLQGGFSVIYDTVGRANTLHDALRWTRGGGTVVLVGVNLHQMRLDLTPVWYREINLLGSMSHGLETWPAGSERRRETFSIIAEMMEQGMLHPEQLITHRFALNNYREALKTAAGKGSSRAIKVAFDYSLQPATAVPNLRASARRRSPIPARTNGPAELEPTSASAPGDNLADDDAWQYSELDEAEQETATALPIITRDRNAGSHTSPNGLAETHEPAISGDESSRRETADEDEAEQATLKFVVPPQLQRKPAPERSHEPEQPREPEPIILADEDRAFATPSTLSTPSVSEHATDLSTLPTLEMFTPTADEPTFTTYEADEAVYPEATASETPNVSDVETVAIPVTGMAALASDPDSETAPVLALADLAPQPDGETEPVPAVEPGDLELTEAELIIVTDPEPAELSSTSELELVDPPTLEYLEPEAIEPHAEPENSQNSAISSSEETAPIASTEAMIEESQSEQSDREAVTTEIAPDQPEMSAEAIASEKTPVQPEMSVETASAEAESSAEEPASETIIAVQTAEPATETIDSPDAEVAREDVLENETTAATETASENAAAEKTPGKRVASRRVSRKPASSENVFGESTKIVETDEDETNSVASALSVEETATNPATPRQRSRRKKTKPSA